MRKIILFLVVSILTISMHAQLYTETVDQTSVDDLLINVDKTLIKNGILYNRVYSFANLDKFNQESRKDTSNYSHFMQSLSELYRASHKKKFLDVDDFKEQLKTKQDGSIVNIGIINSDIFMLNYEKASRSNGLILKNKKFRPVRGKKPFLKRQTLVISPLKEGVKGPKINFKFDKKNWLVNSNNFIKTLNVDLGNGISHTIIQNNKLITPSVYISYKKSGEKVLKFTTIYKDNTSKITYGKLYVNALDLLSKKALSVYPEEEFYGPEGINASIVFDLTDYGESISHKGHLDYKIFYGNMAGKLLKPVIVIDGFDPGDTRKIQDKDVIDPENHESIEEMMEYTLKNGQKDNLIRVLREDYNYDVVIVNHPTYTVSNGIQIDGGADFIERNAMAHIALYRHLNNQLAQNGSNKELIIAAPSMGGQISRYALAYMEGNNIPHNTKLWISIDSPHLGANIPLAGQANVYFLGYIQGDEEAKALYDHFLNSNAAKQQLIRQHSYNSTSPPPFFQQYYSNLNNNGLQNSGGFPQNLRRVALINGSITGNKNGTELEKVLDIRAFKWFVVLVKGFQNENWFMPKPNNRGKVFYGMFRHGDLGLNQTKYSLTTSNTDLRGSMDVVPGGQFNTQELLKKQIENKLIEKEEEGDISYYSIRTHKPTHSFIPTVSSLAFFNSNFDWNSNFDRDLVCTNEIPFDSYYGPQENQKHTSFTYKSVDWILKEMEGTPQLPIVYLNGEDLVGKESICEGMTETYTFNLASCRLQGDVIQWKSSIQIISSTSNSVTVKPYPTSSGEGWIKATFGNGSEVTKNILTGTSSIDDTEFSNGIGETGYFCSSHYNNTYELFPKLPDNPSHQIRLLKYPNLNVVYSPSQNYYGDLGTLNYTPSPGWYVFEVRRTNSCGTSEWVGTEVEFVDCSDGGGGGEEWEKIDENIKQNFSVYPNPVDNELSINIYDNGNAKLKSSIVLFDISGKVIYKAEGIYNVKRVNTSTFAEGLYFLVVTNGEKQLRNKVLIKH